MFKLVLDKRPIRALYSICTMKDLFYYLNPWYNGLFWILTWHATFGLNTIEGSK
jgi:hypothetical protein